VEPVEIACDTDRFPPLELTDVARDDDGVAAGASEPLGDSILKPWELDLPVQVPSTVSPVTTCWKRRRI
jgi:hypothetical protein